MAIDPEKFSKFREQLDELAEAAPISNEKSAAIMQGLVGDALDEVEDLIENSRPPRIYVFGRSGAGKSSLINALTNKDEPVADIGG